MGIGPDFSMRFTGDSRKPLPIIGIRSRCSYRPRMSREYRARQVSPRPPAERLAQLSKPDPLSGCLIWQGGVNEWGYGRISVRTKNYLAHRLAWILKNGSIPRGMDVCHACDERRCVNTDHLFLDTHTANLADWKQKQRQRYRLAMGDAQGCGGIPEDASDAEITPIRLFIRGVQYVGQIVARPFGPIPVIPAPAPPAGRAPRGRSPRCAARRGRPRRTAAPARRGR